MNKIYNKESALIILSHQMDSNGQLDKETLARIELAIKLYKRKEFDFIITSGRDYKDNSDIRIGEAVAEIIKDQYSIANNKVLVDILSRDTVGDAFFLRKNVITPHGINAITVVTTNYHVQRTDMIFKKFFLPSISVKTVGAKMTLDNLDELLVHEKKSYLAFLDTFDKVDLSNDRAVFSALSLKHPFYNGEVYEKLNAY